VQKRYVEKFLISLAEQPADTTVDSSAVQVDSASDFSLWVETKDSDSSSACHVKFYVLCSPDTTSEHFVFPEDSTAITIDSFTTKIVKLSLPVTRFAKIRVEYQNNDDGHTKVVAALQYS
jgi:hypothetical protein